MAMSPPMPRWCWRKRLKAKPRDLADAIAAKLREDDLVTSVDVAGPGFINLTLKSSPGPMRCAR
jgi:arginyl-tRNA synthetase